MKNVIMLQEIYDSFHKITFLKITALLHELLQLLLLLDEA